MTPEELNDLSDDALDAMLAERIGLNDRFTLMKRGLYWRHAAKGYTGNISEAWVLTEAEADKHTYPHDEPVTKHRIPPPRYTRDRNAIAEVEGELTVEHWRTYAPRLENVAIKDLPNVMPEWERLNPSRIIDVALILVRPRQRTIAAILTLQ